MAVTKTAKHNRFYRESANGGKPASDADRLSLPSRNAERFFARRFRIPALKDRACRSLKGRHDCRNLSGTAGIITRLKKVVFLRRFLFFSPQV